MFRLDVCYLLLTEQRENLYFINKAKKKWIDQNFYISLDMCRHTEVLFVYMLVCVLAFMWVKSIFPSSIYFS